MPSRVPPELAARLSRTRLVALDVDGVLTDGRIRYLGTEELQVFSARDGLGLRLLVRSGITVAWISGRGCAATSLRAEELGIRELHVRVEEKAATLAEVQERLGVGIDETLAMGDDLPDLALARRAGLFAAPADAHELVRARADLVTARGGGDGAVRELAEALLRAQGRWDACLARYGLEGG